MPANLQPSKRVNSRQNRETRDRSPKKHFEQAGPSTTSGKDRVGVTSAQAHDIPVRTFFLGEIFGVSDSMGRWRPRVTGQCPWLVTRKQGLPDHPVLMAPSSAFPREKDWVFSTSVAGNELHFLLYYRKPVYREQIGRKIGVLDGMEKQRLAAEFHRVLGVVA
jgi:hypothetical protein